MIENVQNQVSILIDKNNSLNKSMKKTNFKFNAQIKRLHQDIVERKKSVFKHILTIKYFIF